MPKIALDIVATVVSLIVNSVLVVLKLTIGWMFSSISLVADGFDSLLDLVMTIFAGIGERISRKPPDKEHPFGHEKFQLVFSLAIVVTMLFSSYEIAREAIVRIQNKIILDFEWLILIVAIISIVGKLFLSITMGKIGKKLKSPVITALGKNFRSDVITSLLVCVALIGSYFSIWWLDPTCAILIVGIILFAGYEISKISLPGLLDKAPPLEIRKKVKEIALSHPEAKDVHFIRLREVLGKYTGDFHLLVDPELTIHEAHEIAEEVKSELEETEIFTNLIIHIEPHTEEEILKDKSFD